VKRYVNSSTLPLTIIDLVIDGLMEHRGTFIEFRTGMLNISPIGRNCSREERNAYEVFDLVRNGKYNTIFLVERRIGNAVVMAIG
jgi:phosphomannomutase